MTRQTNQNENKETLEWRVWQSLDVKAKYTMIEESEWRGEKGEILISIYIILNKCIYLSLKDSGVNNSIFRSLVYSI